MVNEDAFGAVKADGALYNDIENENSLNKDQSIVITHGKNFGCVDGVWLFKPR